MKEGRWMYSYLTVTSSVNLSTRCVRMLRGSVLPPSCLGGGLLFRHAGRVELHGKRRACTERQKKTGLTRAAESNWQKATQEKAAQKKDGKQAGKWGIFLVQMKNAGLRRTETLHRLVALQQSEMESLSTSLWRGRRMLFRPKSPQENQHPVCVTSRYVRPAVLLHTHTPCVGRLCEMLIT